MQLPNKRPSSKILPMKSILTHMIAGKRQFWWRFFVRCFCLSIIKSIFACLTFDKETCNQPGTLTCTLYWHDEPTKTLAKNKVVCCILAELHAQCALNECSHSISPSTEIDLCTAFPAHMDDGVAFSRNSHHGLKYATASHSQKIPFWGQLNGHIWMERRLCEYYLPFVCLLAQWDLTVNLTKLVWSSGVFSSRNYYASLSKLVKMDIWIRLLRRWWKPLKPGSQNSFLGPFWNRRRLGMHRWELNWREICIIHALVETIKRFRAY